MYYSKYYYILIILSIFGKMLKNGLTKIVIIY